MGMSVIMVMAETVGMIVVVTIAMTAAMGAMGVAVGLAVLVGMGMHLRFYCTRPRNTMQRCEGA